MRLVLAKLEPLVLAKLEPLVLLRLEPRNLLKLEPIVHIGGGSAINGATPSCY